MRSWIFRHHQVLQRLWLRPVEVDEAGCSPGLREVELVPSPRRAFRGW